MIAAVETLLAAMRDMPEVDVEIDERAQHAGVRVGARVVASIDLRDGEVVVQVPEDRIASLRRIFPSSRTTRSGIAFAPVKDECCAEAVAAIRRRVHVERLAWQLRDSSP